DENQGHETNALSQPVARRSKFKDYLVIPGRNCNGTKQEVCAVNRRWFAVYRALPTRKPNIGQNQVSGILSTHFHGNTVRPILPNGGRSGTASRRVIGARGTRIRSEKIILQQNLTVEVGCLHLGKYPRSLRQRHGLVDHERARKGVAVLV